MRCVISLGMLGVIVTAWVAGETAFGADAPPEQWVPLERGEIVMKPTGRKRVTRVADSPPPMASRAEASRVDELSYDGPGRRVVTIGYLVREPHETGWGPLVHEPAYSPCYSYGGRGYGGTYYGYSGSLYGYSGSGYGRSSSCDTPLLFGSRSSSFCAPSAPTISARRGR